MIPRYGRPPRSDIRYTPRPGAYCVLLQSNKIMLTYQAEPWPEFQLPGGGLDPGESPVQALHREVYEETGHRITGPRWLGSYRRFTYMPEYDLYAEKICHIFVARSALRLGEPPEPGHSVHVFRREIGLDLLANSGDRIFAERALSRP